MKNFQDLNTLNLEENDLMNIDGINRLNFPKLNLLGILRNRLSCHHSIAFLRQWENLQLLQNPSNQTHIGGIDCYDGTDSENEATTSDNKNLNVPPVVATNNLSVDVRAVKYLLFGLCLILSVYFVIKSKVIQYIKKRINFNAMEKIVVFQHGEDDTHQNVLLIENGSVKK